MEKKTCTKCGIEKEISEFYKDQQKKTGYRPDCKTCNNSKSLSHAHKNILQRRFNVLKSATGVTKNQYLELLEEQNYKCAICGKTIEENNRNLSVDHCHETKIVRGLLCTKCNFGLGYFNDNIDLLTLAIYYLNNNLSDKNIIHK